MWHKDTLREAETALFEAANLLALSDDAAHRRAFRRLIHQLAYDAMSEMARTVSDWGLIVLGPDEMGIDLDLIGSAYDHRD